MPSFRTITITGHNKFFFYKKNQSKGIIIFFKQRLNVDFYDFNVLENNNIKLSLKIYNIPIVLLGFVCVKHIFYLIVLVLKTCYKKLIIHLI